MKLGQILDCLKCKRPICFFSAFFCFPLVFSDFQALLFSSDLWLLVLFLPRHNCVRLILPSSSSLWPSTYFSGSHLRWLMKAKTSINQPPTYWLGLFLVSLEEKISQRCFSHPPQSQWVSGGWAATSIPFNDFSVGRLKHAEQSQKPSGSWAGGIRSSGILFN